VAATNKVVGFLALASPTAANNKPRRRDALALWALRGTRSVTAALVAWWFAHLTLGDGYLTTAVVHLLSGWVVVAVVPLFLVALLLKARGAAVANVLLLLWWAWIHLHLPPDRPEGKPCLRIGYANAWFVNDRVGALHSEMFRSEADLMFIAEYTPAMDALVRDPWRRVYADPQAHDFGSAVLARVPVQVVPLDMGRATLLRITAMCGEHSVTVFGVHALAPIDDPVSQGWQSNLHQVAEAARETPGPVAVIGDLNVTRHMPSWRALLEVSRLRSAHLEQGRVRDYSWPNTAFGFPFPLFRIDHLLVSPQIDVYRLETGIGSGSDHRPLFADIGIRVKAQ
jgi:endonuclease/exonuclease/phosphatase family metal-dependent hydrolase